jgi:hypothetical protein
VVATNSDGFIRNAIISRYPIVSVTNYNDGLRGLLRGVIDLPGTTNDLAIFDAHLKAFGDLLSSSQRQAEANFDANIIRNWLAGTNLTTVFAGDWNEDESNPQFPIGSNIGIGAYAPISTNIGAGFYNWIAYDTNSLVSNQTLSIRGDLDARFDYLLPATGRFNSIDGFVFNSYTWYSLGILPGALYQDDSSIASDHLPIYARLDFGSSVPEPSILLMSALASFIVIGYRRHRKRTKKPAA